MGLLVIVVLLLVVMPALLYFIGWAVPHYIKRPPSWLASVARRETPGRGRLGEAPAKGEP